MGDLVERLSCIMELHVRVEKTMRSLDQALQDAGAGVSYTEFRALGCVITYGPITLKALADNLGLPKTTVHYVMGNLVDSGRVGRTTMGGRNIPGYVTTPLSREVWGRAAHALLQSPLGHALVITPLTDLELTVQLRRQQWERAGLGHLNAGIAAEANILAQTVLDHLNREQPVE